RQVSLTEVRRRDALEIFEAIVESQDDGVIRQAKLVSPGLNVFVERDNVVVSLQVIKMAKEKPKRNMLFVWIALNRGGIAGNAVITDNRNALAIPPRNQTYDARGE